MIRINSLLNIIIDSTVNIKDSWHYYSHNIVQISA